MTPAARLAAAIEVFTEIETKKRPAADVLRDWGRAHRFAGSGDRSAIGALMFDALRRRASSAFLMGAETPRAILLGMLRLGRRMGVEDIAKLADGSRFAPEALTEDERKRLELGSLGKAPPHIAGDYPEWLDAYLATVFGDERWEEGMALAGRAPLDLRVNTLKTSRDELAKELSHLNASPSRWSPSGLRIELNDDGRQPPVTSEPSFLKGDFEVQDEGSQLAALFAGAASSEQVLDLCAGAGGKTLALAAAMENKGQLFAYDSDLRRLAPIHERLSRAGVRNVQVRSPKGKQDVLSDLEGNMDLVLLDAPCTGSGVWRRHPDAKWRARPGALEIRVKEQSFLLDQAARFVKPGGRLVYITCSVIDAENGAQIRAFRERDPSFEIVSSNEVVKALGENAAVFARAAKFTDEGLQMTPRLTGTDGFFVAVLKRS
ncbi:MAG TPA: RsmB/NOP family class I SAM-dependent RNA methyltransferase [Xanthobacteraceae bacterium]|nr:RsmB/NOP family class I SAM-dependent RNA methyltransferase [Xanthobacteraceae bacterium]